MANSTNSNKKKFLLGTIIILILASMTLTTAEIKNEAKLSGYHAQFFYTNIMTNYHESSTWLDIVGDLGISGKLWAVQDRFEVNELGVHFDGVLLGSSITDIKLTTTTYNGNRGGYTQAHNICQNAFGDNYYVCNELEVDNYQRRHSITLSGTAWVIAGGPKVIGKQPSPADCLGFTTNSNGVAGAFWDFTAKRGATLDCNQQRKIACCRGG